MRRVRRRSRTCSRSQPLPRHISGGSGRAACALGHAAHAPRRAPRCEAGGNHVRHDGRRMLTFGISKALQPRRVTAPGISSGPALMGARQAKGTTVCRRRRVSLAGVGRTAVHGEVALQRGLGATISTSNLEQGAAGEVVRAESRHCRRRSRRDGEGAGERFHDGRVRTAVWRAAGRADRAGATRTRPRPGLVPAPMRRPRSRPAATRRSRCRPAYVEVGLSSGFPVRRRRGR